MHWAAYESICVLTVIYELEHSINALMRIMTNKALAADGTATTASSYKVVNELMALAHPTCIYYASSRCLATTSAQRTVNVVTNEIAINNWFCRWFCRICWRNRLNSWCCLIIRIQCV